VNDQTGEAELKAKFTNKDANPKHFIFCQMIGINKNEQVMQATCDLFYDAVAKKVKCMASNRRFGSFTDNYHFGCKEVTLAGEGSVEIDYGKGQHDAFKGKKASDFLVTYGDYVELPAGAGFDPSNCANCFGRDTTTGLGPRETPDGAKVKIMGDWFLPVLPFDDPYLQFQSMDGQTFPPEYRPLNAPPATPSQFPITVAGLARNVPQPVPATYTVPLNLFDIHTMSEGATNELVALTLVETSSATVPGLFVTDPPEDTPFTIPGDAELFGRLTIHRTPSSPEGTKTEITIMFHEPDGTAGPGAAFFSQHGAFIQDTHPPVVTDHTVSFTPSNSLQVQVTAGDETTTPLAANFWYSTDNGAAWNTLPLEPGTSLFEDLPVRFFSGYTAPVPPDAPIEYFFTVDDEAFNTVFYGLGQTSAPPRLILFAPQFNGTNFQFSFNSQSNRVYLIEVNPALLDGAWEPIQTVPGDGGPKTVTTPVSPSLPFQFFRVRQQ
jgi:hypothetical protein